MPHLGYCRRFTVQQGDCGGQLTLSVDMNSTYSGFTPITCQLHIASIYGGKCHYMQHLNSPIVTSVVHKSSQHSHTCVMQPPSNPATKKTVIFFRSASLLSSCLRTVATEHYYNYLSITELG